MLRLLKRFSWVGCLALGVQSGWGFALLGPNNETYQVPAIGYNPIAFFYADGLASAPKNLGEEYRRNTPVMYYSFNANFLDYFGSEGVAAVDRAFAIMNSLANVSSYSADLSEFPLTTIGENYTAGALELVDIKSVVLAHILEQLGLANPERYTWCLHDRFQTPGTTCPNGMEYLVIQRNFDPVPSAPETLWPSSYVNGTLLNYIIWEFCTLPGGPPPPPNADAYEYVVDPVNAPQFSSVAGLNGVNEFAGAFYTGLTRDDIGGLRYLYRTNNMNTESSGPNTLTSTTNTITQLLFTSNLTDFATLALTSPPATLQALVPGLIITSASNYFQNVWTPVTTAYLTNYPFDPVGTPPHTVLVTNWTVTIGSFWAYTFGNLLTVARSGSSLSAVPLTDLRLNRGWAPIRTDTVTIKPSPFAPAGSGILVTNITSTTSYTNVVMGEFFLLPPGADCGVVVLKNQLTTVVARTNLIYSFTNTISSGTNIVGTNVFITTQNLITYSTNHAYVIQPILCESNTVALRQGIEKVSFVRRDFDSLLGQFFRPITNFYVLNAVTNNGILQQRIQRLVSQPDILISAADFLPGPAALPVWNDFARSINFNVANAYPGLAGPGTIEAPTTFTFNKVGPTYLVPGTGTGTFGTNDLFEGWTYFQDTAFLEPLWGSFDGTTNAPIVFPNGTSIYNLENQVLLQVTNPSLPDGSVGTAYTAQFGVNGGTPPYSWSLAPNSPDLPPGLALDSASGTISGTPTMDGTFDFVIELSDSSGRTSDWNFSITISP